MTDQNLKQILTDLANEAVPPNTDLWPRISVHLREAGRAPQPERGATMFTRVTTTRPRWVRALVWSGLAALLLVMLVAATPQGRALAQAVLKLFEPAPAASFAVTPAPEPASAGQPTAEPPFFYAAGCERTDVACHLAAAEATTGIDARLPAGGIQGLSLAGVTVDPASQWLQLTYLAADGGGLVISQSKAGLPESIWEQVPADQVQLVRVGQAEGEFVTGTFVVRPGSRQAEWNPDAPVLRLRWQAAGLLFEIAKLGDPGPLEYLDQAALVAVAESLE